MNASGSEHECHRWQPQHPWHIGSTNRLLYLRLQWEYCRATKCSRLYVQLTARRKAWSSSRSGGFAVTARSGNKNLLGRINFFIGHCVLQNGRRHRTLSSRRHPLYGPQSHVNAELVERYTSESAVSVALQQFIYVRVSLSSVHSVQFVGDIFYKNWNCRNGETQYFHLVAFKLNFSRRSSSVIVSDVGPSLYRILIVHVSWR